MTRKAWAFVVVTAGSLLFASCDSPSDSGGLGNAAPTITGATSVQAYARERIAFAVAVSDSDNDAVTLSAAGMPAGASLSAAGNFLWQTARTDAGVHSVTIAATDGIDTTRLQVAITVIGHVDVEDTCQRIEILRPDAGATFKVGDTLTIMWAIRTPPGVSRGVRVMLSPDNGMMYAIFNDDAGFTDSDSSIYAGNIGMYRWAVVDSAATPYFSKISMVGDSCRVQIQGDYDENTCTGSRPLKAVSDWAFRISAQ